jgi:hypothetical protein
MVSGIVIKLRAGRFNRTIFYAREILGVKKPAKSGLLVGKKGLQFDHY